MVATGLGHGIANAIIWHGKNNDSSAISKGMVVAIVKTALSFDTGLTGDPIFLIEANTTADGTAGQGGVAGGIARHDIPPGEVGEFTVLGLVEARAAAALSSVNTVLTVDSSSEVADAASGSHQAPCGINLETVSAGEASANTPKWCYVDFITGSFGGSASTPGVRFYGTSF